VKISKRECLFLFVAVVGGCSPSVINLSEPNGGGDATQFEAVAPVEEQLRLAPRTYVASTLKQVFGPSSEVTVQELIEKQITQIGAEACDPYRNDCEEANGVLGLSPNGDSRLPVIPTNTTIRLALVTRACERIVEKDAAVQFAAADILGEAATETLALPSAEDLAAAYEAFNPGKVLPAETLERLLQVASAAGADGAIEAWRFTLLTLCLDPAWQLP